MDLDHSAQAVTKNQKSLPSITHILNFLERIRASGERFYKGTPCWEWHGGKDGKGYGRFQPGCRIKKVSAHRFSHEYFIGEIPKGFEVDHLCRNTGCVSPFHIEAVTEEENRKRKDAAKTTCRLGHPLEGENLYIDPRGRRECRLCRRSSYERWQAKQSEAA